MKFYAVNVLFSNVEFIFSFDTKSERDKYVESKNSSDVFSLTKKELLKRLAHNRKIVRENKKADSGWFNGLPEIMEEIHEVHLPEMRE